MQGQEGTSFAKLDEIPIGFGHLGFHDFHHFIAYRHILNVSRSKVGGVLRMVLDFSQEIGDATPYHAAGPYIAIHVQRAHRGKFQRGPKGRVQIHKPPITGHTQVHIIPIHFPKGGLVAAIQDIRRCRNRVRMKFLYDIGTQSIHTRRHLFNPSHSQGQGSAPFHAGHLIFVIHFDGIQHQIPFGGPFKRRVQFDAIVLCPFVEGFGLFGTALLVTVHQLMKQVRSRRRGQFLFHISTVGKEFATLMPPDIVSLIVCVMHPFVPSYIQQRMGLAHASFFRDHRNGG